MGPARENRLVRRTTSAVHRARFSNEERKETMKNVIFIFPILAAMFTAACNEKDNTQDEAFSVTINSDEGGYRIQTCDDSNVVASSSSGELEETFFIPAEKSPGRCYRVIFDYLDGFYTPDYIEKQLIIGAPVDVEGKYKSSQGTEMITIKANITNASWWIEQTSDGTTVGSGPAIPDEGDEIHSYELWCNPETPGLGYKVYFGDVAGCTTPDPKSFELICEEPKDITGTYLCN
jgi:hypothetical protein